MTPYEELHVGMTRERERKVLYCSLCGHSINDDYGVCSSDCELDFTFNRAPRVVVTCVWKTVETLVSIQPGASDSKVRRKKAKGDK